MSNGIIYKGVHEAKIWANSHKIQCDINTIQRYMNEILQLL